MNEKAYLDKSDIMNRYDCGINKAKSIIKSIKEASGGVLGKGKVLPSEIEYWERKIIERKMK